MAGGVPSGATEGSSMGPPSPLCFFIVKKEKVFGANMAPKNEPEEQNNWWLAGPMPLPSVAPEGTPPAMLLKKLAFGIKPLSEVPRT